MGRSAEASGRHDSAQQISLTGGPIIEQHSRQIQSLVAVVDSLDNTTRNCFTVFRYCLVRHGLNNYRDCEYGGLNSSKSLSVAACKIEAPE